MASTPQPKPRPQVHTRTASPPKKQLTNGGVSIPPSSSSLCVDSARQKLESILNRPLCAAEDISRHTLEIAEQVLTQSRVMQSLNFTSTSVGDLQRMAEMYDQRFFEGSLLSLARHFGMSFRWSSRMTSAGGKTIRSTVRPRGTRETKTTYEIALSATLLFQTFGDLDRPIRVTGHKCVNRMQAMQRILEHELIHLAEMLIWDDSNCSANRFQSIAHRMFTHTEHKHDLVTQQERAAKRYNIRVGSIVSFAYEGHRYVGKVNRITRRATILVLDPHGERYTDGKCYRKYYVPLGHLNPVGA